MRDAAGKAGKRLATLTLTSEVRFASPAARTAFAEDLATAFAGLCAKYHDESAEDGRLFRFFVGGHPAPKKAADRGGTGRGASGSDHGRGEE